MIDLRARYDERVETVLEGDEAAVNEVRTFCQQCPSQAQVSVAQVIWATYRRAFDNFRIRSTS